MRTQGTAPDDLRLAARLVAVALLCLLILFLSLLQLDSSIPALGNTWSLVYSLMVSSPFIAVALLAIAKSR